MRYYVFAIEQISSEGTLSEYSTQEKVNDEQLALSKFYKKLSDVSNDIGKGHTYMDIRILNSIGGMVKHDKVGEYIDDAPQE